MAGMGREVSQKGTGPHRMKSLGASCYLLARETEAQGGTVTRSSKLWSAL